MNTRISKEGHVVHFARSITADVIEEMMDEFRDDRVCVIVVDADTNWQQSGGYNTAICYANSMFNFNAKVVPDEDWLEQPYYLNGWEKAGFQLVQVECDKNFFGGNYGSMNSENLYIWVAEDESIEDAVNKYTQYEAANMVWYTVDSLPHSDEF